MINIYHDKSKMPNFLPKKLPNLNLYFINFYVVIFTIYNFIFFLYFKIIFVCFLFLAFLYFKDFKNYSLNDFEKIILNEFNIGNDKY